MTADDVVIRRAERSDAGRLAELHATRIVEGFLPRLGPRFLSRLYRRLVVSPDGFAVVAVRDTRVVGFAAGATDLGRVYRSFVVHDGLIAGLGAAPRIVRSWRSVLETLRYPGSIDDLPEAEILSVAVDGEAAGRGIGRMLLSASLDELTRRGARGAKVVAGADNRAALALYLQAGFAVRKRIEVHAGTASEVLVWVAP
jgi:ribosomal protein S18 acetylase RimI-like enzyme